MKKILLLMFVLAACQRPTSGSLGAFFTDFRKAVQQKDEVKMREMTLDFTVRKPKINLQEGIVKGALEARPNGDFAYSDASVVLLIKKYLDKFKSINEDELKQIADEFNFAAHPTLKDLKAEDVFRLEIAPVKVVALRINGDFYLFYWRDLPALATNAE